MARTETITRSRSEPVVINKVLKNTYALLAMTLLFSGAMAYLAMVTNAPMLNPFMVMIGYFGLLFLVHFTQNSGFGILSVFALTGFMGYTLGPILNLYMANLGNGAQIISIALGGTGIIFLGLSAYTIVSRKDFSFMGGFLCAGILVAFIAGIAAMIFKMPMLSLGVSVMFMLLSSGIILYKTSEIVHGGETNYISATVTLYVSLYNIFTTLLHILGVFGGDD